MGKVRLTDHSGELFEADESEVAALENRGFRRISEGQELDHRIDAKYRREAGDSTLRAVGETILDSATFGGFNAVQRAAGVDPKALQARHDSLGGLATGLDIGTTLGTAVLTGGGSLAAKLGAKGAGRALVKGAALTPAGMTAKLGSKVLKTRAGLVGAGVVEGSLYGAGQGIRQVVRSEEPITAERLASAISTQSLLGAATGGIAGGAVNILGKGFSAGLSKSRKILAKGRAAESTTGVMDDLAAYNKALDDVKPYESVVDPRNKTLGSAQKGVRDAELRLANAEKQLDTLQSSGRATEKQLHSAELKASRADTALTRATEKLDKATLAPAVFDEFKVAASGGIGYRKTLEKVLKGDAQAVAGRLQSKATAEKVMNALSEEAGFLRTLAGSADDIKALRAAKGITGSVDDKLAAIPSLLERNARITEAVRPFMEGTASAGARGFVGQLAGNSAGGLAFGGVMTLTGGNPLAIAPAALAARKVGSVVENLLNGKVSKVISAQSERIEAAVTALSVGGAKAKRYAPLTAVKVFEGISYGDAPAKEKPRKAKDSGERLANAYKERASEIRAKVISRGEGGYQVRPEVRQQAAEQLSALATINPILADRLESMMARRLEFLASKLPKAPEIFAMNPDISWTPSEMDMRKAARYMAAAEDPAGAIERATTGDVTPEAAETLQALYPELLTDIRMQVAEKRFASKKPQRYAQRLALSVLTGTPLDPSLHPRIIRQLQASYASEPGTEGGTTPPTPQPQFGSVTNQEATPAQERQLS